MIRCINHPIFSLNLVQMLLMILTVVTFLYLFIILASDYGPQTTHVMIAAQAWKVFSFALGAVVLNLYIQTRRQEALIIKLLQAEP